MRTETITVAIPPDAEWRTVDADGEITYWRALPEMGINSWRGGEHCGYVWTGIPCEEWRDSLTKLDGGDQ